MSKSHHSTINVLVDLCIVLLCDIPLLYRAGWDGCRQTRRCATLRRNYDPWGSGRPTLQLQSLHQGHAMVCRFITPAESKHKGRVQ